MVTEQTPTRSRRALLAGAAAGAATLAAESLARPIAARAASGDYLILGQGNVAEDTTSLDGGGLDVTSGTQSWFAIRGTSSDGVAVRGESQSNFGMSGVTESGDCGVQGATENPQGAGVWGGGGHDGIGVRGSSFESTINDGVLGAGVGVRGESDSGDGVLGETRTGAGVHGLSTEGPGVRGESDAGCGVFGMSQNNDGVRGESADQSGVSGSSDTSFGVSGMSNAPLQTFGAGVFGSAPSGCGVWGMSDSGRGVFGYGNPGGVGVMGQSDTGIGVQAESGNGSGLALNVWGRSAFSSAGRGTIASGRDRVTIDPAPVPLSDTSVVLVTLLGNPRGTRRNSPSVTLSHVEIPSQDKFDIVLTGPAGRDVVIAYLIIEQPA